jgi:hypothetical protein
VLLNFIQFFTANKQANIWKSFAKVHRFLFLFLFVTLVWFCNAKDQYQGFSHTKAIALP